MMPKEQDGGTHVPDFTSVTSVLRKKWCIVHLYVNDPYASALGGSPATSAA